MRTAIAVVLAVVGTAVAFSALPRGKAAGTPYLHVGRYTLMRGWGEGYGERVMMLDTATGGIWELESEPNYCMGPGGVVTVRPSSGKCGSDESAVGGLEEFVRVSAEGLYQTRIQKMVDRGQIRYWQGHPGQTESLPKK